MGDVGWLNSKTALLPSVRVAVGSSTVAGRGGAVRREGVGQSKDNNITTLWAWNETWKLTEQNVLQAYFTIP